MLLPPHKMKSPLVLLAVGLLCCIASVSTEPVCVDLEQFLKKYEKLLSLLEHNTTPVFTLCTNETAIDYYNEAVGHYRNMTNAHECQKYMVAKRLNLYQMVYDQLNALWSAANCEACIGAVNDTAEFMRLSDAVQKCFTAHSTSACVSCEPDYLQVQQFYGQLEKGRHGVAMCFDVEDRMNQTRQRWSGQFNCCKDKQRSMVAFGSIASVACVFPLAFYLVMHLVARRSEASQLSLLNAMSTADTPPAPAPAPAPAGRTTAPRGAGVARKDERPSSSIQEGEDAEPVHGESTNDLNNSTVNLIEISPPTDEHLNQLAAQRSPEKNINKLHDTFANDDDSFLQ
ncbi:osteopetrosis-associated transmembrane protein 1-like [Anopheles aquasalis]|uniref:osteopetrosis-associated transmembrane protein 1-like n=1 Tax=Anopheles aquasalis TaxID=42839 RepID=UPI00215AD481|nr:osteopetrosis-associated transmembrane protein 1-like [Anopheles aquasalis]XP_050088319.1 osteopetrosis-associated transmembrane protein 1-like [Anopheles aquasalis]